MRSEKKSEMLIDEQKESMGVFVRFVVLPGGQALNMMSNGREPTRAEAFRLILTVLRPHF